MNQIGIHRRHALHGLAAGAATAVVGPAAARAQDHKQSSFGYCLNTSTIGGQKLGLVEEIEIAADAGYDGIEPWIREIETYVSQGGQVADLRKRIEDRGLKVESAIGFSQWIVDDADLRSLALEQTRREMDLVRQIGGTRIAAPPAGATEGPELDLDQVARRYRQLLEIGEQIGVCPQLEVWGFSKNLHRLGEVVYVAVESGHPAACILPDVYHIYRGGSDFSGLRLLHGSAMQVFHVNDYPASPSRASICDADRVYPGDGVAPLNKILQTLTQVGFQGALSLELFNPNYWKQDAVFVARTGLIKMKAAVARAAKTKQNTKVPKP
jgi:2-keto-myo-inositol isomerase